MLRTQYVNVKATDCGSVDSIVFAPIEAAETDTSWRRPAWDRRSASDQPRTLQVLTLRPDLQFILLLRTVDLTFIVQSFEIV